jgi:hypothetical protein
VPEDWALACRKKGRRARRTVLGRSILNDLNAIVTNQTSENEEVDEFRSKDRN